MTTTSSHEREGRNRKGLAVTKAPTRLKDISVSTRDSFMINPRTIVIDDGFNPRDYTAPENQEHIRMLADSIKAVGVKNPITVRYADGKAILVDGECRLRATLLAISEGADITAIKAIQEDKGTTAADRKLSTVILNSGKTFNMLELGRGFAELIAFGYDEALIVKRTGHKAHLVSNALELHGASDALKALVRSGQVSATHALDELRRGGESAAVGVLTAAAVVAEEVGAKRILPKHVKAVRERSAPPCPLTVQRPTRPTKPFLAARRPRASILAAIGTTRPTSRPATVAPEEPVFVSPVDPPKPTKVERIVTREMGRALIEAMIAIHELTSESDVRALAERALANAGVQPTRESASA